MFLYLFFGDECLVPQPIHNLFLKRVQLPASRGHGCMGQWYDYKIYSTKYFSTVIFLVLQGRENDYKTWGKFHLRGKGVFSQQKLIF